MKGSLRLHHGWFVLAIFLGACAGPPPAPVEDRSSSSGYQSTPDGYYRVKKGDSLYAISFRFGVDWRSIAQWNDISAPYVIHPDQLLRLNDGSRTQASQSNRDTSGTGVSTAAARVPDSQTRPLDTHPRSTTRELTEPSQPDVAGTDTPPPVVKSSTTVASSTPSKGSQQPAGVTYTPPAGDPDRWIWPTEGPVISKFQSNDPTRKGLDIGGQAGQKVVAAAAGEVVYSGSGLIGYGELIIIKHSDRMLSAYAHNRNRLVSEGDQVPAGSTIAEMGTNDRNQAILHFEIRVNGVPSDPLNFLPAR